MSARLLFLAAVSLTLLARPPLRGQTLRLSLTGRVVDAETGHPVAAAVIERDRRHRVIADGEGRFAFTGLEAGHYSLIASSLGYEDARLDLDVAPGVVATIRMSAKPVPLPAILAVARASIPGLPGTIHARVFGREDLLKFDDVAVYHFVHERAHIAVQPCNAGARPWLGIVPGTSLPDWGEIGAGFHDCIHVNHRWIPVRVYVDDQRISYYSDELYAHRAWDLARVEVLRDYTSGLAIVRIYTAPYMERRAARVYRLCDQLSAFDSTGVGGLWSLCSPMR